MSDEDRTNKGTEPVGRRVYYTLAQEEHLSASAHRMAHVLGSVVELLHDQGLLSDDELDRLLVAATS